MASSNFGQFLAHLAQSSDKGSPAILASLKEKLEKEKAERIENRLRIVFSDIESQVSIIRRARRTETEAKNRIRELEKRANDIIAGKFEE